MVVALQRCACARSEVDCRILCGTRGRGAFGLTDPSPRRNLFIIRRHSILDRREKTLALDCRGGGGSIAVCFRSRIHAVVGRVDAARQSTPAAVSALVTKACDRVIRLVLSFAF